MALMQKRAVADPAMGVSDVMRALRGFMSKSREWDLHQLTQHPQGSKAFSWKTSPHPAWMAQCSDLVQELLKIAPNGLVTSSKLKTAVAKLAQERKINFTTMSEDDFQDAIDMRIRVVLSQYRAVKMSKEAAQRCLRKASDLEGEQIQKVLSRLSVDGTSTSSTQKETSLALVPYKNQEQKKEQKDIYKRILQKNDSMDSNTDPGLARKVTTPKRKPSPKAPKKGGSGCLLVEPEDSSAAGSPTPVKKPKGASNFAAGNENYGLSSEDMDLVENHLGTELEKSKPPKILKKPAGKAVSLQKEKEKKQKEKEKKKVQEKKTKVEKVEKKEKKKKGKGKAKKTTSFRHRATSSAYHKAKKAAKKLGYDMETCKSMARAASRKVAQQIDNGILKET